jgi:hypothetical protein
MSDGKARKMKYFLVHLEQSNRGFVDEAYFIVCEMSLEDARIAAKELQESWGIKSVCIEEINMNLGDTYNITSRYS